MNVMPPGYRICVVCNQRGVRLPEAACRGCLNRMPADERTELNETLAPQTQRFVVVGQPVPKGRPRVANGRAFTPERTKAWESEVALLAQAQGVRPFDADADVAAYISIVAARGDLDNHVKAILDALNGIAYHDDKQVTRLAAWIERDGAPGIEVTLCTYVGMCADFTFDSEEDT